MTLCFGAENNANLLDCGLGAMLAGGLLFGHYRKHGMAIYGCIGISFLFLLFPVPRINTMSQPTGVVLLYRSSGSFLYPFMHGTQQANFDIYSAGLGWVQALAFCGRFFLQPVMLMPAGAALAAAVLFPDRLSGVFAASAIVTGAALAL